MDAIKNWFSPANREKIYTAIAALAPILVTAGVILPSEVEPYMVIVAAGLQAIGGLLALINLRPTEAARWFGTVGRGVIYTAATGVAGAVVALGFITQDFATTALTYTSFGLTALAAILAVVTPKEVEFSRGEIPAVSAVVADEAIVVPEINTEEIEITNENISAGYVEESEEDTGDLFDAEGNPIDQPGMPD